MLAPPHALLQGSDVISWGVLESSPFFPLNHTDSRDLTVERKFRARYESTQTPSHLSTGQQSVCRSTKAEKESGSILVVLQVLQSKVAF